MNDVVRLIKVKDDTYDELTKLGKKNDTYDDIIKDLLRRARR